MVGTATAKDVEREFKNIVGSKTWKWTARPCSDNKFIMRFPNSRMIKEWNYFISLPMRTVNAEMKVDFYNGSLGAKGELQQAWFRIWNIPAD